MTAAAGSTTLWTEESVPGTAVIMPEPARLTYLLERARSGEPGAASQVADAVYGELRRLASYYMKGESVGHTLQPTALVHEVYLRLLGPDPVHFQDRQHFFVLAAQTMRRVLVDHAREKKAKKRGDGAVRVELAAADGAVNGDDVDVLALHEALEGLQQIDNRAARVVELRYFGGYADQEIAELTGESLARVRRDWQFAKAWLHQKMTNG